MTVKASSLLAILAVWATMVPAVVAEPDAWWSLIFAAMATAAIGVSAWRRLGLARVIAIAGTWLATALVVADEPGNAWVAVLAFLATGAVVYSTLRRDALVAGAGIAATWLIVATATLANEGEGAWTSVFAFLTAGLVANSGRASTTRGAAAVLWWGIAGAVMVIGEGWQWLAPIAFVLTAVALGAGDFQLPRRIEWDLFERDDDAPRVR